jgi:hypothetical protein
LEVILITDIHPPRALGIARGRRITNRQIARHLGVSQDWVCRVMVGRVHAPERFRFGLAEMLGVDAGELFE